MMNKIDNRMFLVILVIIFLIAYSIWYDHSFNPRHAERWVQPCQLEWGTK